MTNEQETERKQLTRLQLASLRLKEQVSDITARSSRCTTLTQGPLSAPEVLSMLLANQVCIMMALVDFIDSLEAGPLYDS